MNMKTYRIIPVFALLLTTSFALASFYPSGGSTYRLQSSIGSTNTVIPLSSFLEPGSNIPYTMAYLNSNIECGTLDPQTSKSEFISFTGITQNSDGTAVLLGVQRGLGRSYPYTASSTLAFPHSGQSAFILSDSPCLFIQYAAKQNNEAITGTWTVPDPTTPTSIANKEYVDGAAFGGIGGASETATGTVQIATGAQAAASTKNGSSGRLVLPSSLSTSTWSATVPVGTVPVIGSIGGKIDPNFVGNLATSTLIGYQGAYSIGKNIQVFTAGTSTFKVPSGVQKVEVTVQAPGAPGGSCFGSIITTGGGGGGGYTFGIVDVSATTSIQVFVGATTTATTSQATWSTFGTNGFYLSTLGGSPSQSVTSNQSNGTGGIGGVGVGGSLNIQGQSGTTGLGYITNTTGPVFTLYNGIGGNSELGFGSTDQSTPALGATGYGGGGAGATCPGGGTFYRTGGQATNGTVVVQW